MMDAALMLVIPGVIVVAIVADFAVLLDWLWRLLATLLEIRG